MSEGLPLLDAEHPWPGLFPYAEDAHAFFNGRERETVDLLRLVRRDTLTLLYGQSGLGKSSLLRAGLFPQLREEAMLPIYLRLDFRNREIGLREQVWNLLRVALDGAGIDGRPPRDNESLWAYFHAADVELWDSNNRIVTPVLVLDQFEEIVQAGEERERAPRLDAFMEELADLLENRIPQAVTTQLELDPDAVAAFDFNARHFRCVIGFREDFLPDLEQRFLRHSLATKSRLRVNKMGAEQALTAVEKTGGRLLDRDVALQIVNFVSAATANVARHTVEIEPALLSVVCFELNTRRLAQNAARMSPDLLAGAQEQIIAEFYQRSVADLDPTVQTFIERELLTESGYRDSCALEDAVQRHGIARDALQKLVDRRVLRLEERFGVLRVELTHDVLTPVVRDRRDQRQALEGRERERQRDAARQKRTRMSIAIGGGLIAVASVLLVVFFNLFRQAESEKARVIEAQSTLFLSRANASLESNIPAEPIRYLAQALQLNPRNDGAIARLASLATQRHFARNVWEREFEHSGGSAGAAVTMANDGFAFMSTRNDLRFAKILPGKPHPTLQESCAIMQPAEGGSDLLMSFKFDASLLNVPTASARIAESEIKLSGVDNSPEAYRKFTVQCAGAVDRKANRGLDNRIFKAVEPDSGAIWAMVGKSLLRFSGVVDQRETVPGLDEAGELSLIMPSRNGQAVIVVGDKAALLYARTASASGVSAYVRKAAIAQANREMNQVVGVIAATFDQSGSVALVTVDDGTCHLWETANAAKRWSRPCAKEAHLIVPGKPWVAFLGQPATDKNTEASKGLTGGQVEIVDIAGGQTLGVVVQPLAVNHIAFSSSGELVVVASQDRTAKIYKLPMLTPIGNSLLHEGAVVEAHFRPGVTEQVVTASFDGSARVWDWQLGKMVVEPMLHPGPVLFARPVLNGAYVLSLGDDRRLRLWRVSVSTDFTPALTKLLQRPAVSPAGDRLAYIEDGNRPGAGDRVMLARIATEPTRDTPLIEPTPVHTAKGAVEGLYFSDDGRKLAVAGRGPWLTIVRTEKDSSEQHLRFPSPVERAKFVPGGALIVVQLIDDSLHVMDLSTGRESGLPIRLGEPILDFGISQDGKWLSVATGAQLQVFDLLTGYPVERIAPGGVVAAAAHPSRAEIAYATRAGLYFWRPLLRTHGKKKEKGEERKSTGKAAREFAKGEGVFLPLKKLLVGLRYTPDGRTLAAYSIDGLATSWDTATLEPGPLLRHSSAVVSMGLSGDGRWLTTTTLDGFARIWDYRTGQLMADAADLRDSEYDFRVVGNGTWALVESSDSSVLSKLPPANPAHAGLPARTLRGFELRLLGLGFNQAPPTWFVPTVVALASGTNDQAIASLNVTKQESSASAWWESWLTYVAAKNGVTFK